MVVHDGELIVVGDFTSAGGAAANRIAAWDGTSWPPSGGVSTSRVARWNGSQWSSATGAHGSGLSTTAFALHTLGSTLYVGGEFTYVGRGPTLEDFVVTRGIAAFDGSSWSQVGRGWGFGNVVYEIEVAELELYVGASFNQLSGDPMEYVGKWDGSQWVPMGSGIVGAPLTILVNPGSGAIYIGGNFHTAGAKPSSNFARWEGEAAADAPQPLAVTPLVLEAGPILSTTW